MTKVDPPSIGPGNTDPFPLSERLKLMGDGLVNNLTLLVSGVVGIVLVPLMLKWLGPESYGIWIVAMAITGMLSTADLGLYPTVVREVSSSLQEGADGESSLFIEGAGNVYVLLGMAGVLLLGVLGYAFIGRLHLDSQLQGTARIVFWLIGLGFLVDQLNVFGGAVLIGLRRFDYANMSKSGIVVFRAAGIIALLAMGRSLVSIALWQAIAAAVGVVVTFSLVRHSMPQFHFRLGRLHWPQLRKRIAFATSSLLTTVFGGLVWQSGALLIGILQGSSSVVPFYIGEKFPHTAAIFGWQTSEALFPAAGESQNNLLRTREILRVGARWVLVLMLPVTSLLWLVGPNLLSVWIGKLDSEALEVLRLLSLAALADAFMAASLNVLWGRAAMRQVVFTMIGVGLATICLTVALVPQMGVMGAAWGALLPTIAGSCTLFFLACRDCGVNVVRMTRSLFRGLLWPVVGCTVAAYIVSVWERSGVLSLVVACLAGSIIYTLLLYVAPGQNEERRFLQCAFRRVASLL